MHDGSRVHHIATIAATDEPIPLPGSDKAIPLPIPSLDKAIFLPSFHEENRGLHWIKDPTSQDSQVP